MILALTCNPVVLIAAALIGLIGGAAAMRSFRLIKDRKNREQLEQQADSIIKNAQLEAEKIRQKGELDAKAQYVRRSEQFEKEAIETRNEFRETERRLAKREDN
ncbi:MAG: DUF3552 domain-containing protein, partial [Phycisphaerae bacterium]|nr:DUF3552 domain-containing protein [Phycisphaerae bacterium]